MLVGLGSFNIFICCASPWQTSCKMCKLYVVLISKLSPELSVCVDMLLAFSPPPLLLISTSVIQSNLIRNQFSSLCLSVFSSPLQDTVTGMDADLHSSRAGWAECEADTRSLHHGYISNAAGHACEIRLHNEGEGKKSAFLNVTFSSYQQLWHPAPTVCTFSVGLY